jgi:hypothetical protein
VFVTVYVAAQTPPVTHSITKATAALRIIAIALRVLE